MPNKPPCSRTSWADSRARRLALPPPRLIGIWPTARKNHAVFLSSKYSALATNVTRRRSTSGRKIESEKDRWLLASMAGPFLGRFSSPSTRTRNRNRRIGVRTAFSTQYITPPEATHQRRAHVLTARSSARTVAPYEPPTHPAGPRPAQPADGLRGPPLR